MLVHNDPSSTHISATLELPGIERNDLSIVRQGDTLVVSGERDSPIPTELHPTMVAARYPIREFKYGKYRREVYLTPGTLVSPLSSAYNVSILTSISFPYRAVQHLITQA